VPDGVPLVAGMTATVTVAEPAAERGVLETALARAASALRGVTGRAREPSGPAP
jgi:hypothetical protein